MYPSQLRTIASYQIIDDMYVTNITCTTSVMQPLKQPLKQIPYVGYDMDTKSINKYVLFTIYLSCTF